MTTMATHSIDTTGWLRKMPAVLNDQGLVEYRLPWSIDGLDDGMGEGLVLNDLIGQQLILTFTGQKACVCCGRMIQKTFQQGYCFPCVRRLPETDLCQMKPEECHFAKGTCRDPEWGQLHCFRPHTLYLANSSGLKIGITRQVPTKRWIDQGASQGLALWQSKTRLDAGRVEFALKQKINDKTNWRKMLAGVPEPLDLESFVEEMVSLLPEDVVLTPLAVSNVVIQYPVLSYPDKIKSLNFDNQSQFAGRLIGIKGQYLMLDQGVINIPKFSGYQIRLQCPGGKPA